MFKLIMYKVEMRQFFYTHAHAGLKSFWVSESETQIAPRLSGKCLFCHLLFKTIFSLNVLTIGHHSLTAYHLANLTVTSVRKKQTTAIVFKAKQTVQRTTSFDQIDVDPSVQSLLLEFYAISHMKNRTG